MGPDDFVYRRESPKPRKQSGERSLAELHGETIHAAKTSEPERLLNALLTIAEQPHARGVLRATLQASVQDLEEANRADLHSPEYHKDDEGYDARIIGRVTVMHELQDVLDRTSSEEELHGALLALKSKYDQAADAWRAQAIPPSAEPS